MIRSLILASLLALTTFGATQTTNGKASGMSTAQIAKVKKTKFRVLVPTFVPAGFRLQTCGIEEEKDPLSAMWSATYRNAKTGGKFVIQMASDGLGDPMFDLPNGDVVDPTGYTTVQNPILGKVAVGYYQKGKIRIANCTWYETKSKSYPKYAMIMCDGMALTDVKRVLAGLRWLK